MDLIKARYRDDTEFLAAYQSQFLHGGLFVPTTAEYQLGMQVVVEVRYPCLRTPLSIRGFVAWRRPGRRSQMRGGIGVEFLASERNKRDFLLGAVRGEIVDIMQRRHRRIPVQVRVQWRIKEDRGRYSSQIEDIGEGGAFIRTTDFHPIGAALLLDVSVPGSERHITLQGRVAWTRHTVGDEGMGVEFRCRDSGGTRRLRELIRRIEERHYRSAAI